MADDNEGGRDAAGAESFFVVDDEAAEAGGIARDEADEAPADDSRAMSDVRVRQLAADRRATHRARSYCLVAVGVCAVALAQLVVMTVRHVRAAGWQLRPVGYVCGAIAAAMTGAFFVRRAAELAAELRRRPASLAEPQTPPDFSTLSDGSHQWKNLERMKDGG